MKKIYLANESKQSLGGGFTFLRNLRKGIERVGKDSGYEMTDSFGESDIFFISGATMIERTDVELAKQMGKKVVLRVDNIPRNSRNRNTGTSRLFDFAQMADLVIFQSVWARHYISPFIKKWGPVILNGVDTKIFNKTGDRYERQGFPQFIYVRYNRDETKRWEKAWYDYQMIQRHNPDAHLWIVGAFSNEQMTYNFDFFQGEKFKYWGVIEDPNELAKIYRSADKLLCPYYRDACSNVVAESLASGLKVDYDFDESGGIAEQIQRGIIKLEEMTMDYIREFDYHLFGGEDKN